ncbi:MAG: hypothetical protein C5B49_05910 [Bdellovibrio sp.]|nr:MAG: hypothetical protein C5B49_05910 [Bdellovibrio sp.]
MDFLMQSLMRIRPAGCIFCGWPTVEEQQICRPCSHSLALRLNSERSQVKSETHALLPRLRVRYLFRWQPNLDPAVSALVSALKGGRSRGSWKILAHHFIRHHGMDLDHLKNIQDLAIVPVPSSKPDRRDHAFHWGEALAGTFQAPFLSPLRRKSSGNFEQPQKRLNRQKRVTGRMIFEPANPSQDPSSPRACDGSDAHASQVVLVDDIITTGATTKSAAEALNSIQNEVLEIWTLAYRSRLAQPLQLW